ncbi:ankyrin repeat domain-containing protein [Streptomyces sp. NPDC058471]|uniref:ankyrin repeat domain-containing protein n=1 Tax=Streptomyces sp. NPDC058471 TaxID=3346516 RepID=UPI0036550EA4
MFSPGNTLADNFRADDIPLRNPSGGEWARWQVRDDRGMDTADQLVRSAGAGDVIEVARLLGQGAVVDAPGRGGRTALDLAAEQGHADVVRQLLAAGADLGQPAGEYQELTPLCLAASRGHTAVAGVLLRGPNKDVGRVGG